MPYVWVQGAKTTWANANRVTIIIHVKPCIHNWLIVSLNLSLKG